MKTHTINGSGAGGTPPRRPFEQDIPPRAELAFDPLSPIVACPVEDSSSSEDALALDPLGPIPRFSRAKGTT